MSFWGALLWSSWVYLSVFQLFCTASHLILLSSTTVDKNSIQRHRKTFWARYSLLQPKEWNRGVVSLQEAFLPWINLELPCLLSNLVWDLACQVWRWSYSSFGFQKISVLDTADSSLDLFLPGHKCPGIMNRVYWFKGHRFSKKKDRLTLLSCGRSNCL